jgi:hypothetical protein
LNQQIGGGGKMNKRLLKIIFLCLLALSLMACNLQDLLNAAMPSATPQAAAETEAPAPVIEFPETFTPPVVDVATILAEALAQTQTAQVTQTESTQTPTITETPTITMSPTITPLTYTPTAPPTVTATWTATPVTPTATPKTGTKRSGTSVTATYLSSPPSIDGDWTEWSTDTYSASSVIYGSDAWVGSSDLECNFRLGWDYQYLYIAAEVIDDSYAQNASGYDIYKGDSLEILLDANVEGDYSSSAMSGDDYQLGISPGKGDTNGATSAYLYYPSGSRGSKSVSIGATGGSSVYYVEAAIPWSLFGVTPKDGNHYGFAFSVSDNDNPFGAYSVEGISVQSPSINY